MAREGSCQPGSARHIGYIQLENDRTLARSTVDAENVLHHPRNHQQRRKVDCATALTPLRTGMGRLVNYLVGRGGTSGPFSN